MKLPARRILVRCPNWVGDTVMATPALRCLRENYPAARIVLLLRPYVREVVEAAPWFDEVIEIPRGGEQIGPRAWAALVRRLRSERFDLAMVLPNSFRAALLAAAAGVRRRVGYVRDARRLLLTHPIERPTERGRFKPTYMGEFYLNLCEHLGCVARDRRPQVFTTPDDDAQAESVLPRGGGPLVLVAPGASFGASKHWPSERFAEVADRLIRIWDAQIAITGSRSEAPLAQAIAAAMKGSATDLTEVGSLGLLKSLTARCDLVLTVDSGTRHVAVALGVPTVVLMGPTHPGYTATPYESGEVIRADVDCAPCQRRRCPTDHRCMLEITPQQVFRACVRALGSRSL